MPNKRTGSLYNSIMRLIQEILHSARILVLTYTILSLHIVLGLLGFLYPRLPSLVKQHLDQIYLHSTLLQSIFCFQLSNFSWTTGDLHIEELCTKHGITYQLHQVLCADNGILTIHRLTLCPLRSLSFVADLDSLHQRDEDENTASNSALRAAVVIIAGPGMDAEHYLSSNHTSRCLPARLLHEGYDVWLVHSRGSKYFQSAFFNMNHPVSNLKGKLYSSSLLHSDFSRTLSYISNNGYQSVAIIGFSTAAKLILNSLKYLSVPLQRQVKSVIFLSPYASNYSNTFFMNQVLHFFSSIPMFTVCKCKCWKSLEQLKDVVTPYVHASLVRCLYALCWGPCFLSVAPDDLKQHLLHFQNGRFLSSTFLYEHKDLVDYMDPFPSISKNPFLGKTPAVTSNSNNAMFWTTDSDTHYSSGSVGSALLEVKPIAFLGENDNISQWVGNSEKEIVFRIPHYHHFDVLWGVDVMDIVFTPLLNLLHSQVGKRQ